MTALPPRSFISKPIERPYVPLKTGLGVFKIALRLRDQHVLKDTQREKAQIKFDHFRKLWNLTFGWFVQQTNSLYEVLKLKQNFCESKLVTGKTPSFVIGPFCIQHSICFNFGF